MNCRSFMPEIGHGHYCIPPLLWSNRTSLKLLVLTNNKMRGYMIADSQMSVLHLKTHITTSMGTTWSNSTTACPAASLCSMFQYSLHHNITVLLISLIVLFSLVTAVHPDLFPRLGWWQGKRQFGPKNPEWWSGLSRRHVAGCRVNCDTAFDEGPRTATRVQRLIWCNPAASFL